MTDYPECTKLFDLEISEHCVYRAGSQCVHEGLICTHSEGETIFRGVSIETHLKVKAELTRLQQFEAKALPILQAVKKYEPKWEVNQGNRYMEDGMRHSNFYLCDFCGSICLSSSSFKHKHDCPVKQAADLLAER